MAHQYLAPVKPGEPSRFIEQVLQPLSQLRTEIDRAFNDFPARWPGLSIPPRLASIMPMPAVEMTETDKAYKVAVEVPGIPAADIEVEAVEGLLVIKGEKKEEREDEEQDFTRSERSYGAFERRIALPQDAKVGDISAKASDGVLKITVPRDTKAASARRKIEIKGAKKD